MAARAAAKPKNLGPAGFAPVKCSLQRIKIMPKPAKKAAVKKPAKPAKTAPKPAKKAAPAAARPKAAAAAPARVVTRRRAGKSEVVKLISSVTNEEIALRAYYIGERRRNLGLPGDSQSDWLEAERQLRVR